MDQPKRKNTPYLSEAHTHRLREQVGATFRNMHCRTLDDMTPEEIRAIEEEYGAQVIRSQDT
jgi:hypothetical protein